MTKLLSFPTIFEIKDVQLESMGVEDYEKEELERETTVRLDSIIKMCPDAFDDKPIGTATRITLSSGDEFVTTLDYDSARHQWNYFLNAAD